MGVVAALLGPFFGKKTRWTPVSLMRGIVEGMKMGVVAAAACGSAGLVIGTFYVSGLGPRLSDSLISASQGSLPAALILVALASLILGMAMPVVPVYITLVITSIPICCRHIPVNTLESRFLPGYMNPGFQTMRQCLNRPTLTRQRNRR